MLGVRGFRAANEVLDETAETRMGELIMLVLMLIAITIAQ